METRFEEYSNIELIETFNTEVWNKWWTSARAEYLVWIHEEFNKRWFDYSEIWDEKQLSFKDKVVLIDKKIKRVVKKLLSNFTKQLINKLN